MKFPITFLIYQILPLSKGKGKTMSNIGEFEKTDNGFQGRIKTLEVNADVRLVALEKAEGEKGPDFRAYAANGAEIGAAWNKTGVQSGKSYISVLIDDPSMTAPINANLIAQDNGKFNLLFSRANKSQSKDQDAVLPNDRKNGEASNGDANQPSNQDR